MQGSYTRSVGKFVQGQIEGSLLAVSRSVEHDTLTYTIGLFNIVASKHGVSFAGSSVNFNLQQMVSFGKYVRQATYASECLAAGTGMPHEEELSGKLKIKTRSMASGSCEAWYQGFRDSCFSASTPQLALKGLRRNALPTGRRTGGPSKR